VYTSVRSWVQPNDLVVEDAVEVAQDFRIYLRSLHMHSDGMAHVLRDEGREACSCRVELRDTSWDAGLTGRGARNAVESAEDPVSVTGDDMNIASERRSRSRETAECEEDTLSHWLLRSSSEVNRLVCVVRPESEVELIGVRSSGDQVAVLE